MSYGLTIKNNEGKTFISPNVTPMNFIKKMNIWIPKRSGGTTKKYLDTGITDNYTVLPFIRAVGGHNLAPAMLSRIFSKNGIITIEITHYGYLEYNLEVYLFANLVPKLTNYGLEIYNENHDVIYNNTCRPLEMEFLKKPDHSLFGKDNAGKLRDSVMIDMGHPVAALCTSYGLKSFTSGANVGWVTYHLFSTAINNSAGLNLIHQGGGKFRLKYPHIGDIPYIDIRKYE